MIVLLDTSLEGTAGNDWERCERELGCEVGQLLTPLTGFRLYRPDSPWAIDNGAFAGFDAKAFKSRLQRQENDKRNCKFVTAPDVVASARRTLEVFERWKNQLAGWPIALAMQDGQEELPIPWEDISAIFVGGSTNWKIGLHATACIQAAKALGKWVHVGRVNDPARFAHFLNLGVDSIDGSGIARYSHMREAIGKRDNQEKLFAS